MHFLSAYFRESCIFWDYLVLLRVVRVTNIYWYFSCARYSGKSIDRSFYIILLIILWGMGYIYPNLQILRPDSNKWSNLLKVIQLLNGRTGIWTHLESSSRGQIILPLDCFFPVMSEIAYFHLKKILFKNSLSLYAKAHRPYVGAFKLLFPWEIITKANDGLVSLVG